MTPSKWGVRLGGLARRDIQQIVRWTKARFGSKQATVYRDTILAALRDLEGGPDPAGSRRRDDLGPGVRTLHVMRQGRRGRHLLLYRALDGQVIEVARILHDAMELERHALDEEGAGDEGA